MSIWLHSDFRKTVRKAFPSKDCQKKVYDVLDDLYGRMNSGRTDDWERSHSPKSGPQFNGNDAKNLYHYKIDQVMVGSRLLCYLVDEELLGIHSTRVSDLKKGDWILACVVAPGEHDREKAIGVALRPRIYSSDCSFDSYVPESVKTGGDVNAARKAKINTACGIGASRCPLPSYEDYCAAVELYGAREVLLSREQFSILNEFGTKDVPVLMMGCAGSGKTQLIETLLNYLKPETTTVPQRGPRSNAYFVLSEKLRATTEAQATKIAASKIKVDLAEYLQFAATQSCFHWLKNEWETSFLSKLEQSLIRLFDSDTISKGKIEALFDETLTEVFLSHSRNRFLEITETAFKNREWLVSRLDEQSRERFLCTVFLQQAKNSMIPLPVEISSSRQMTSLWRCVFRAFLRNCPDAVFPGGEEASVRSLTTVFEKSLSCNESIANVGTDADCQALLGTFQIVIEQAVRYPDNLLAQISEKDWEEFCSRGLLLFFGGEAPSTIYSNDDDVFWRNLCWKNSIACFLKEAQERLKASDFKASRAWLETTYNTALRQSFAQSMREMGGIDGFPDRLFSAQPQFCNANVFLFELIRPTEPEIFRSVKFHPFDRSEYERWKKRGGGASKRLETERLLEYLNFEEEKSNESSKEKYYKGPNFVNYALFQFWYNHWKTQEGNRLVSEGLDDKTVWTQIRGVIKGFLGAATTVDKARNCHWGRSSFSKGDARRYGQDFQFADAAWHLLAGMEDPDEPENKFASFRGQSGEWILNVASDEKFNLAKEKASRLAIDSEGIQRCLETIVSSAGFRSDKKVFVDEDKTELSLAEYLRLKEEQCELVVEPGVRERVYKIYERYREELLKGSRYLLDENDLARKAVVIASDDGFVQRFDSVFVDECQDFTEMQILALLLLGRPDGRKVLSGDRQQIINQTYFSPKRMKELLKTVHQYRPDQAASVDDQSEKLSTNFRCTQQIIETANRVKAERKRKVSSLDQVSELTENAQPDNRGEEVQFCCFSSREDEKVFFSKMAEDSGAIIIVAGAEEKLRLKNLVPPDKQEALDGMLYSIEECKGLENDRVICFDLFSSFRDDWERISESSGKVESGARYRYCFNVLYVGVTRAQKQLMVLESGRDFHNGRERTNPFQTAAFWLPNREVGPVRLDSIQPEHNAREAYDKGMKDLADWRSSDSKDQVLERAYQSFLKAKNYHSAKCGVEMDEIDARIRACEAAKTERAGDPIKAALMLADPDYDLYEEQKALSESDSLTSEERVLAEFLREPSFSNGSPGQARDIVHAIGADPIGRFAIRKACRSSISTITQQLMVCSELLGCSKLLGMSL